MVLFIWNVDVAGSARTGGLAAALATIAAVLNISDFIHIFDNEKSSSFSQLIKGKSRNLQKLFNENKTSVSNVLISAGVFPIIFYTQNIYLLLPCCSLSYH